RTVSSGIDVSSVANPALHGDAASRACRACARITRVPSDTAANKPSVAAPHGHLRRGLEPWPETCGMAERYLTGTSRKIIRKPWLRRRDAGRVLRYRRPR